MALLYCECGHCVWSELWWKESRHVLLFFDGLETSETYGERITSCPGCDWQLRSVTLRSASDEYSSEAYRRRETV